MSNTCLVTKLKSVVDNSDLVKMEEYIVDFAAGTDIEIIPNASQSISGNVTNTITVENANIWGNDGTTNFGNTYSSNIKDTRTKVMLKPIDELKGVRMHYQTKYSAVQLILQQKDFGLIKYANPNILVLNDNIVNFNEPLPKNESISIINILKSAYRTNRENVAATGNLGTFVQNLTSLKNVVIYGITNVSEGEQYTVNISDFLKFKNYMGNMAFSNAKFYIKLEDIVQFTKLALINFDGANKKFMSDKKIQFEELVDGWIKNGMVPKTTNSPMTLNQCGTWMEVNHINMETELRNWTYATFDNKDKYAIYYGALAMAACPKIIAKGYNDSEIQAWQDAGKTVTVIE